MTVRIDDVGDGDALRAGALDELVGRVGGIDEDALRGIAVGQQVPEIAVTAGAKLFEDHFHRSDQIKDTKVAKDTKIAMGTKVERREVSTIYCPQKSGVEKGSRRRGRASA
jgi:hypothetical protein